MDLNDRTRTFWAALVIGLLTLISGSAGLGELRYLLWGQSCDARIVNIYEDRNRSRISKPHTAVVYQYSDAGQQRQDSDQMPLGWQPQDRTLRIEYIPGRDYSSRIEGHGNRWIAWIFVTCCVTICIASVRIVFRRFYGPI